MAKYVTYKAPSQPYDLDWLMRWTMPIPFCGCYIWMGSLNKGGYGSVGFRGKTRNAFRVAFELARGPIPEGLEPDHLCRIRSCVNPDHLELVTRSINLTRGRGGEVRRARANKITHCPLGHSYSGHNLYADRKGRRGCRSCRQAASDRYVLRKKKSNGN